MGKNKFTTTVLTSNMPTCQGGHDLGPLIPDITIPPANVYLPIAWPFSKREIVFQASTVKLQGTAAGCAASPFLPMMTCGDPVSMPTALPIPINYLHRVFVGITMADILTGILKISISVLIDGIFHMVGGGPGNPGAKAGEEAMERAAREFTEKQAREFAERTARNVIGKEILGKLVPTNPAAAAKAAVSALAGYRESQFNEWLNPSGNAPSTNVSILGGAVNVTFGGQPDQGPDNAPAGSGEVVRGHIGEQRVTGNTSGGDFDPLNIFGG